MDFKPLSESKPDKYFSSQCWLSVNIKNWWQLCNSLLTPNSHENSKENSRPIVKEMCDLRHREGALHHHASEKERASSWCSWILSLQFKTGFKFSTSITAASTVVTVPWHKCSCLTTSSKGSTGHRWGTWQCRWPGRFLYWRGKKKSARLNCGSFNGSRWSSVLVCICSVFEPSCSKLRCTVLFYFSRAHGWNTSGCVCSQAPLCHNIRWDSQCSNSHFIVVQLCASSQLMQHYNNNIWYPATQYRLSGLRMSR